MDHSKSLSMAKAMKFIPVFLGIACLALGFVALFVKTETEAKQNILFFALFGILGLMAMVFGLAFSSLFEVVAEKEKTSPDEDDDVDILA